ncbi:MAG: ribonuclease PH [Nitrospirae bacterium]|nr:ribonuclease PH [Nitrospirota bacterium]
MRPDKRADDELRSIKITRNFLNTAEGSVLVEAGNTKVICTASIEDRVPPFLKELERGWVTAEYSMLPRSTPTRMMRDATTGKVCGRTHEIQRPIGRTMRSVIALSDAVTYAMKNKIIGKNPIKDFVAAVSVGIVDGEPLLDLSYAEDSTAEVDMNIVMTGSGKFIEVQGTAESAPFDKEQFQRLLDLAESGIKKIIGIQRSVLGNTG